MFDCTSCRSAVSGCRFAALRKLLPRAEKADKASFLISAAEYIKELQVAHFLPQMHPNQLRLKRALPL